MAIQLPNPGLGDGQTGDNEFVMWTKVKDNFSNATHAASRLVGAGEKDVVTNENLNQSFFGGKILIVNSSATDNIDEPSFDMRAWDFERVLGTTIQNWGRYAFVATIKTASVEGFRAQLALPYSVPGKNHGLAVRSSDSSGWGEWYVMWHNKNATKDSNGFLKASSPIVKVFADKVELNSDAVSQNVTYKKNGVGDYTITTVSGLSTDGWYIELPKDMNGNPKVAVTLSEVDGVISLKSYKRIFSMETFTFEPDLDSPLDIPDTRWIDLRLNEIHVEMPDDIQTEV